MAEFKSPGTAEYSSCQSRPPQQKAMRDGVLQEGYTLPNSHKPITPSAFQRPCRVTAGVLGNKCYLLASTAQVRLLKPSSGFSRIGLVFLVLVALVAIIGVGVYVALNRQGTTASSSIAQSSVTSISCLPNCIPITNTSSSGEGNIVTVFVLSRGYESYQVFVSGTCTYGAGTVAINFTTTITTTALVNYTSSVSGSTTGLARSTTLEFSYTIATTITHTTTLSVTTTSSGCPTVV